MVVEVREVRLGMILESDLPGFAGSGRRERVKDDSQRPGLGSRIEGWVFVEKGKRRGERSLGEKLAFQSAAASLGCPKSQASRAASWVVRHASPERADGGIRAESQVTAQGESTGEDGKCPGMSLEGTQHLDGGCRMLRRSSQQGWRLPGRCGVTVVSWGQGEALSGGGGLLHQLLP